jgi:hypothetical protein
LIELWKLDAATEWDRTNAEVAARVEARPKPRLALIGFPAPKPKPASEPANDPGPSKTETALNVPGKVKRPLAEIMKGADLKKLKEPEDELEDEREGGVEVEERIEVGEEPAQTFEMFEALEAPKDEAFLALPGVAGEVQQHYLETSPQPSVALSQMVGLMVPTALVCDKVTGPGGPRGCTVQQFSVGLAPPPVARNGPMTRSRT